MLMVDLPSGILSFMTFCFSVFLYYTHFFSVYQTV